MLEDDKNHAVRFEAAHYFAPTHDGPGRISADFIVDREPNAGRYLVLEATEILWGDTDQVAASIESLATGYLRQATGTSARIRDDGYSIHIETDIPPATGNTTETAVNTPSAETPEPPTAAQSETLFQLEMAIHHLLPADERQHTGALAQLIANDLPSQAQVVNAYYRPTLAEVLDYHERRMDAYAGRGEEPAVPSSLKTTQLSFPQHPSTALTHHPRSVVATETAYAFETGERVYLEP